MVRKHPTTHPSQAKMSKQKSRRPKSAVRCSAVRTETPMAQSLPSLHSARALRRSASKTKPSLLKVPDMVNTYGIRVQPSTSSFQSQRADSTLDALAELRLALSHVEALPTSSVAKRLREAKEHEARAFIARRHWSLLRCHVRGQRGCFARRCSSHASVVLRTTNLNSPVAKSAIGDCGEPSMSTVEGMYGMLFPAPPKPKPQKKGHPLPLSARPAWNNTRRVSQSRIEREPWKRF
mgnify:CR=1 FL=1